MKGLEMQSFEDKKIFIVIVKQTGHREDQSMTLSLSELPIILAPF